MTGHVDMRTVYVRPDYQPRTLPTCTVVNVTALLRELIVRIVDFRGAYDARSPHARIVRVFFDEIRAAEQVPLHLPLPSDHRLQRITTALRENPGDQRTLSQWSSVAGGSERTLARLFTAETRMTFGQWRQQARLLRALEALAQGEAVTTVALDLGYDSPSAFIAMFRRALGVSPGRYYDQRASASSSDPSYRSTARSSSRRRSSRSRRTFSRSSSRGPRGSWRWLSSCCWSSWW